MRKADPAFLTWLYEKNPSAHGPREDLLIAESNGEIVGVHHRMRLVWTDGKTAWEGSSLHDLYVRPTSRSGIGLKLILQGQAGQGFVLAAGLSGASEGIYRRLRAAKANLRWQQRRFLDVQSSLRLAASMLGRRSGPMRDRFEAEYRIGDFHAMVSSTPSQADLEEVLALPQYGIRVAWDPSSYRWRFFDVDAPFALLVAILKDGRVCGRAVISIGLRRRIPVARLLDGAVGRGFEWREWVMVVNRVIDGTGVPIAVAATSNQPAADALESAGWADRKSAPGARLISSRGGQSQDLNIWGGAWDLGFDDRWVA